MTSSVGKGLDIAAMASSILDGIVDHFAAAGVELPDRRYVAAGNPALIAWDCEQLVVSLEGIGWGQSVESGGQNTKIMAQLSAVGVRNAVFSVQLVRCTAKAEGRNPFPDPEKIHETGIQFFRDSGLISQALVSIAAEARHGLDPTGLVQAGAVSTLGPEGGYHAVEATITVSAGVLV